MDESMTACPHRLLDTTVSHQGLCEGFASWAKVDEMETTRVHAYRSIIFISEEYTKSFTTLVIYVRSH
jgi:hypothetical protein